MRFFFFGTLMDEDVLQLVLERPAARLRRRHAFLPGYRRLRIRGESFPMLAAAEGEELRGLLVEGLEEEDLARIEFFESVEYAASLMQVRLEEGGWIAAHVFAATEQARHDGEPWDFVAWQQREKPQLLAESALWMGLYGHVSAVEGDRLWRAADAEGRSRASVLEQFRASDHGRAAACLHLASGLLRRG